MEKAYWLKQTTCYEFNNNKYLKKQMFIHDVNIKGSKTADIIKGDITYHHIA